jgi:four helix bundle protein
MVVTRFENLFVWQLASELERQVLASSATSPARADLEFCRQIRASASSAPRNIAEGFGRFWPREFAHKLRIARGELEETQSALSVALLQKYVTEDQHSEMYRVANRAIGAATRLLQYLDTAGDDWKKGFLAAQRRPKGREE